MSTDLQWFKSTYSSEQGGECLELAPSLNPAGNLTIHIRDSKSPQGPTLHIAQATWTTFLTALPPLGSHT
ncbi:DUF397 domain-containing protein [Streptomyces silvensis]|uniref:DUF397 domain-containing protein n=1 Tax=Streptomyces silvensis TaxID=1765722 RepID=A0A0W7XAX7_9ACTN|nr:DUF397 domain-containing protein [Streptomyces silvensis]KUF19730.1 hypothetical protein AT728_05095 [Streptomyces silvensis]